MSGENKVCVCVCVCGGGGGGGRGIIQMSANILPSMIQNLLAQWEESL